MTNDDKKVEWIRVDGENVDTANLAPDVARQAQDLIDQCEQAVALARSSNNRHEEGIQLDKLGEARLRLGQARQAIECYEQAAAIFHELGDEREEANNHTLLGMAYLFLKDAKNVHAHHMQAWEIYNRIGDQAGVAKELRNLASFYEIVGQPDKAVDFYRHALAILHEIGDRDREATTLVSLGILCMQSGQAKQATELHEQALTIFRQLGNRHEETTVLLNLGTFQLQLKQWDRALTYYNEALGLCRETGDRDQEALLLKNIGVVYFGMREVEKAIAATQSAIRIYEETGYPGVDNARKQLEHLSRLKAQKKTPRLIALPVGLIFMLIFAIFLNIMSRSSNAGNTTVPPTSSRPPTGTLAGMVLDKNRKPLVNTQQGEMGILALVCPGDNPDAECLHENDTAMDDVSVLVASICDIDNSADTCLLHWGRSAAKIEANGSYILRDVPPGQYDLLLMISDSGIAMTLHILNVDPVTANQITLYEFVTE